MDILTKLEWCCVEIPEGSSSFRSILTLQEIKQNNFTGDEIGENIISEGLAGKKIFFGTLKMGEKLGGTRVKFIFPRSEIANFTQKLSIILSRMLLKRVGFGELATLLISTAKNVRLDF